jgi:hypothetical protein
MPIGYGARASMHARWQRRLPRIGREPPQLRYVASAAAQDLIGGPVKTLLVRRGAGRLWASCPKRRRTLAGGHLDQLLGPPRAPTFRKATNGGLKRPCLSQKDP